MRTHGYRERSITHWGLWEDLGEGQRGVGNWGGITWGEMPDIGDGEEGSKSHCHVYTYATIRNDEFVLFVGTWMNLENIIFSKLTQE